VSAGRHHLLSFGVAVLALALGLGLGAGPVTERAADTAAGQSGRLQAEVDRLEASAAAQEDRSARDRAALEAMGAPLADGVLDDRRVLVVATAAARNGDVRRMRTALEDAGASVTGVLTLRPAYGDPANAQTPLEDLSLRLVPPGVEFPDGSTPIERVGAVLARATVQLPEDDADPATDIDQDGAELIAGLDELGALRLDGDPGLRAELAVVVGGPDEAAEAESALTGLVAALDAGSRGAVVTAPGAGDAGLLRWVRDDKGSDLDGVSTVDDVGGTAGTVATVLALAEQVDGEAGDYGTGRGARGVLPSVAADG
jgi:hypothetical protein